MSFVVDRNLQAAESRELENFGSAVDKSLAFSVGVLVNLIAEKNCLARVEKIEMTKSSNTITEAFGKLVELVGNQIAERNCSESDERDLV